MAQQPADATPVPAAAERVSVADFGAKPDDGKDDTNAFLQAIEKCRRSGSRQLVIPTGRYAISADALSLANAKALTFENINDFTLQGNGSTLLFTGRTTALSFINCRNVKVEKLTIDWERPYFSQGTVLDTHDLTLDLEVDAAYPVIGTEKFEAMMDYDPVSRLPIGNIDVLANSGIAACELIRPQVLRITLKTPPRAEQERHFRDVFKTLKGKLLVLRHVVYGNYGIDMSNCQNVVLEDVAIYTAPGMGIHAELGENISLKRVGVRIRPGSGRLMSTTADCQYYTHCLGTITIEDSYFEGMGDDGLNICGKYKTITKIINPTTIESLVEGGSWRWTTPKTGDTIEIVDSKSLEVRATVTVKKGEWDRAANVFRTELAAPLPPTVRVKDFLSTTTHLPKARIARSTFRGMRARAMLFSTRDIVIEDCKIEAPAFAGIMLMAGSRSAYQGPAVENIVIRNCVFDGCGGTAVYADASVPKPSYAHRMIVIENNVIRGNKELDSLRFKKDHPTWVYWNSAICLKAVDDVSIQNNQISGYAPAIFLDCAKNVRITGNKLEGGSSVVTCEGNVEDVRILDGQGVAQETNGKDYDSGINFINIFR